MTSKNNHDGAKMGAAAIGGAIIGAATAVAATKVLSDPKNREKIKHAGDQVVKKGQAEMQKALDKR